MKTRLNIVEDYSGNQGDAQDVAQKGLTQKERNALLNEVIAIDHRYTIGKTLDDGGCFFHSLADIFNTIFDTTKFNEKLLRKICLDYYCHSNENKEEIDALLRKDSPRQDDEQNYQHVQYTKVELDQLQINKPAVWGRPEIEGRILCKVFGFPGIQVTELLKSAEGSEYTLGYYLASTSDYRQIQKADLVKDLDCVPTIIASQENLHFVPILSKCYEKKSIVTVSSTIQSVVELKKSVLKDILNNQCEEYEIENLDELDELITLKTERIADLESRCKTKTMLKRQNSLNGLLKLKELAGQIEQLQRPPVQNNTKTLDIDDKLEAIMDKESRLSQTTDDDASDSSDSNGLDILLNTQIKANKVVDLNELRYAEDTIDHLMVLLLGLHEDKSSEKFSYTHVEKLIANLKEQLQKEELMTHEIESKHQELQRYCHSENWKKANGRLQQISRLIRPFDISMLVQLLEKSDASVNLLDGQDIVLMLGGTGAGKSTTIHYMAGSKMERVLIDGLEHIQPKTNSNKYLDTVTTSPYAQSETQHISAVPVEVADICESTDTVLLCDTPGFEDTNGPEVDVANGVGTIRAVSKCRSVRPFVLVSKKSIGNRFEGLKNLAHTLTGLVPDLKDHIKTFSYGFTNYQAKEQKQIQASIKHILSTLSEEEKTDVSYFSLFKDLKKKTRHDVMVIDPLSENSIDLLEEIMDTPAIKHPGEVFTCNISGKSRAAIKEQVLKHQLYIQSALKRNDYVIIKEKLEQLLFLSSTLDNRFIEQIYQDCCSSISKQIMNTYQSAITTIDRGLRIDNSLELEDIEVFKQSMSTIESSEALSKILTNTNVVHSNALSLHLDGKVGEMLKTLPELSVASIQYKIIFDKLKLISGKFNQFDEQYQTAKSQLLNNFVHISECASKAIESFDLSLTTKYLDEVYACSNNLAEHFDGNELEREYNQCRTNIHDQLDNQFCQHDQALMKPYLEDSEIIELDKTAKLCDNMMNNMLLQNHLSNEKLNNLKQEFYKKLLEHFGLIKNKMLALFKSKEKKSMQEIRTKITQLDSLRTIHGMDSLTSKDYYSVIELICSYAHEIRRDAEQQIQELSNHIETNSSPAKSGGYRRLTRSLHALHNMKWIEEVRPGIYADLSADIIDDLIFYAENIKNDLLDIEIDLNNSANIESAYSLLVEFSALCSFSTFAPGLNEYKKTIEAYFDTSISTSLDIIEASFDLEKENIARMRSDMEDLIKIKDECESFHPCKVLLRENEYTSIEEIQQNIDAKRQELELAKSKSERDLRILVKEHESLSNIQKEIQNNTMSGNFLTSLSSGNKTQQILTDNGFVDQKDLYDEILDVQDKIKTKQQVSADYLDVLHKKIEGLEELHANCLSLKGSKKLTSQALAILKTHEFANLSHLEGAIASLRQQIDHLDAQGFKYVFDSVNYEKAELALSFLKESKKVCKRSPNIKARVETLFNNFHEYFNQYGKFMRDQLRVIFDEIINTDGTDKIVHNIQHFVNLLDEMSQCSAKYKNIFYYLSANEDILSKWSKIISDHVEDLNSAMSTHLNVNDNIMLKHKLELTKMLKHLDKFITEGEKYRDLYRRYLDGYHKKTSTTLDNIIRLIDEYNFQGVRKLLQTFTPDDNDRTSLELDEAVDTLRKTIRILLEETRGDALLLGKELDVMKVRKLINRLKVINSAKSEVTAYLTENLKEEIDILLEEVCHYLNQTFHYFLNSIEANIKVSNFYESAQRLYVAKIVKQLLVTENVLTNLNIENLDRLEQEIHQMLGVIVKKYNNMPLEELISNPPKLIYEKLKPVFSHDAKYSQAWSQISSIVTTKLNNLLKAIDLSVGGRNQISLCRSLMTTLPEDLRTGFDSKLSNYLEMLEHQKNSHMQNVTEALQSNDVASMCTYINEFSKSGMSQLKSYLSDNVMKKLDIFKLDIEQAIAQERYLDALRLYTKSSSYVKLRSHVSGIESYLGAIREQFHTILNKHCEIISNLDMFSSPRVNTTFVDKISKSFLCIIGFIYHMNDNKLDDLSHAFDSTLFRKKISTASDQAVNFLNNLANKYTQLIEDRDFVGLNDYMSLLKNSDSLILTIQGNLHIYLSYLKLKDTTESICTIKDYVSQKKTLFLYLDDLRVTLLNLNMINSETRHSKKQRTAFYESLSQKLTILQSAKCLIEHVNRSVINIGNAYIDVIGQHEDNLNKLFDEAMRIVSKEEISPSECDQYNVLYENFCALAEHVPQLKAISNDMCHKLNDKITDRIYGYEKKAKESTDDTEQYAHYLKALKRLSDTIPQYKEKIDTTIDKLLDTFKKKYIGGKGLNRLGVILDKDESGVGQSIIAEHKCFKGYAVSLFNTITQRHDISYVLNNIKGDAIDKGKLKNRYNEFDVIYKKLIKDYLAPEVNFEKLVSNIHMIIGHVETTSDKIDWDSTIRSKIPNLMAHIFALWTLKNAHYYFDTSALQEDDRKNYLLQPHAAQVISIYRILGVGDSKEQLSNNLVQIGTGEGKSVTLAVTAIILALFGVEVNCVCYSDYLSRRDYDAFHGLFELLGINNLVKYGTFTKLCEDIINEDGDIRERVRAMIRGHEHKPNQSTTKKHPRILLVDEVDVFFNSDFYGNTYSPVADMTDDNIKSLINYIWKNRESNDLITNVKRSKEYSTCVEQFGDFGYLIEEAVKDLIADLDTYQSHDYLVHNDKIAYKEQDGISYNVVFGYKTLFAYFHEHEQGKISNASLEENICITINCGHFSYADTPSRFQYILGVSGTLKTLSKPENQVIKKEYGINRFTYMPSVFGKNNLIFREDVNVKIENESDFQMMLTDEIKASLATSNKDVQRAVLVFFESKERLMQFYDSKAFEEYRENVKIMTEDVDVAEKFSIIKRATTSGQITLLSRCFGRGTDFVCRDQNVNNNGGIHVIQTFLSESLSEETQIKGRTARQGQKGSYSMVLKESELEKFGVDSDCLETIRSKGKVYKTLSDKRNSFFEKEYKTNNEHIAVVQKEHTNSEKFVNALNINDINFVHAYLKERNQGAMVETKSRTVVVMDATGSMYHLLSKAKNTVGTMFERAAKILAENQISKKAFEMQFACYRNYNSTEDQLLQASTWETKPEVLREFMKTIEASGGWYGEAVEVGLWHANQEAENGRVTQVILIGDAPGNTPEEVTEARSIRGEHYWQKTKFDQPTTIDQETDKLAAKSIPVHGFFVANWAKNSFKKIAKKTKGRSESLDIDSDTGAEVLTSLVTEEILRNVGGSERGQQLVDSYRAQFSKAYK